MRQRGARQEITLRTRRGEPPSRGRRRASPPTVAPLRRGFFFFVFILWLWLLRQAYIAALDMPNYFVTFAALLSTVLTLTLPDAPATVDDIVDVLAGIFGLPPADFAFVTVEFLPTLRAATAELTLTRLERVSLGFKFTGVMIKLGCALCAVFVLIKLVCALCAVLCFLRVLDHTRRVSSGCLFTRRVSLARAAAFWLLARRRRRGAITGRAATPKPRA